MTVRNHSLHLVSGSYVSPKFVFCFVFPLKQHVAYPHARTPGHAGPVVGQGRQGRAEAGRSGSLRRYRKRVLLLQSGDPHVIDIVSTRPDETNMRQANASGGALTRGRLWLEEVGGRADGGRGGEGL